MANMRANGTPFFREFSEDISSIPVPLAFTYPFFYEPHELTLKAASEVQSYLSKEHITHNFGLGGIHSHLLEQGKMFGVMVARNKAGNLGYLAAYSGKLEEQKDTHYFVPPICDIHAANSFYKKGESQLNKMSAEIVALSEDSDYLSWRETCVARISSITEELATGRKRLRENKKERQLRRSSAEGTLTLPAFTQFCEELASESISSQVAFKHHAIGLKKEMDSLQKNLDKKAQDIAHIAMDRKAKSNLLQREIFDQYRFINAHGDYEALSNLFPDFEERKPPSGSGDCCAPKLLQFAYTNDLEPICMGEFWWGNAPNKEIREHGNYYQACGSRCRPILGHMLQGLNVEDNPLQSWGDDLSLKTVYEDDSVFIVNKPAGLLSVPGREIEDSAFTRVLERFPLATNHLLVHRLDMSTSGLLIFTKTKKANKRVQRQFIQRTLKKRYIALLDGLLDADEGTIDLPLTPDYYDLPRQLVCHETGKVATTHFKVLERKEGRTRVALYPVTGRTHQLRVHCAHHEGLGIPIVGDELYGKREERLHLHAQYITFEHPMTREIVEFSVEPDF